MPDPRIAETDEQRAVLLVSTLTAFTTPFMASSINIALPAIADEFTLSAVALTWVATAFILPAAILLLPFGRLADIRGRKRVFSSGIVLYTVASILCSLAPSAALLIAFRVLQGISAAMVFSTSSALLTSVYPASKRGRVLGLNVAAVYFGQSVGPSLGGLMVQWLGWRSIFLGSAALGVITIVQVWRRLHGEWTGASDERFDFIGTGIYAVAFTAVMFGLGELPAMAGAGWILAGIVGLTWFLGWEWRLPHPVLELRLFTRNSVFAFSSLAALINYSATFALTFLLSLYLQYVKGLSPQNAGFVLVAQPIMMSIFSPIAGRLSDRVEPRTLTSTGMGCTLAALLLFTFLRGDTPLLHIVACLLLNGLGFAFFSSPNTNAIMSSVERRFYGVASAVTATMRMTGQMLSMGITMLLFTLYIGSVPIATASHDSFLQSLHAIFIVFAIISVGGVLASLARGTLYSPIEQPDHSAPGKH